MIRYFGQPYEGSDDEANDIIAAMKRAEAQKMKVPPNLDLDFVQQPHFRTVKCEAQVKDQPAGWRTNRGYGNNCQRNAVYKVGDKRLCRLHAGNEILDLLFKDHPTHFYRSANQPSLQRKP